MIPQIKLSELQKLEWVKLTAHPSAEIVSNDGDYLATLIVPPKDGGMTIFDHTKTQALYLGVQGNIAHAGTSKKENQCHICDKVCASPLGLSSHKRSHVAR